MIDYAQPGNLAFYLATLDARLWLTAKLRLDYRTAVSASNALIDRRRLEVEHRSSLIAEAWQLFLVTRPPSSMVIGPPPRRAA